MMLNVSIKLILLVLAVYRIAHMMVGEDGPFDLFINLRTYIHIHTKPDSNLQRGFSCVLCMSFWVSCFICPPILLWSSVVLDTILVTLGVAGANLILHKVIYG